MFARSLILSSGRGVLDGLPQCPRVAYESMTEKNILLDYIKFFDFRIFVLTAVNSSLILFYTL
jgi:hypothetical protein